MGQEQQEQHWWDWEQEQRERREWEQEAWIRRFVHTKWQSLASSVSVAAVAVATAMQDPETSKKQVDQLLEDLRDRHEYMQHCASTTGDRWGGVNHWGPGYGDMYGV